MYAESSLVCFQVKYLQNCYLCIIKIYVEKYVKQTEFISAANAYNPIMFMLSNYASDDGIFLILPYCFAPGSGGESATAQKGFLCDKGQSSQAFLPIKLRLNKNIVRKRTSTQFKAYKV